MYEVLRILKTYTYFKNIKIKKCVYRAIKYAPFQPGSDDVKLTEASGLAKIFAHTSSPAKHNHQLSVFLIEKVNVKEKVHKTIGKVIFF